MSKELIIISGPNGSGKTTFAKSFLGFENFKFLNADEITIELEIQNEKVRNYITGREYFKRLEKLSKSNNNIILESTFQVSLYRNILRNLSVKNIQ